MLDIYANTDSYFGKLHPLMSRSCGALGVTDVEGLPFPHPHSQLSSGKAETQKCLLTRHPTGPRLENQDLQHPQVVFYPLLSFKCRISKGQN